MLFPFSQMRVAMFDLPFDTVLPILIICAIGLGLKMLESGLKKPKRRASNRRQRPSKSKPRVVYQDKTALLSRVSWTARPLMNKSEYRVFTQLEHLTGQSVSGHRVFTQVSMGEILGTDSRSADRLTCIDAYRQINSKRVDFLIIDRGGMPVAALEYQGGGHYQSGAVERDSVKREVFRLAGVPFVEIAKAGLSQGQLVDIRNILGLPTTVAAE